MSIRGDVIRRSISRRTFLQGVGSLATVPFLAGLGGTALTSACGSRSSADAGNSNTRLVILGSSGGVSYWPGSDRASSSSALVVGDSIYLIDLGQGSTNRLCQAFNLDPIINPDGTYCGTGSPTFLKKVKALFFTHLHQDHIADFPNLLLIGPGAGLGAVVNSGICLVPQKPLKVFGPCDRGQLDIDKSSFVKCGGKVIFTESAQLSRVTPTPGTRQMTDLVWQAFAQAINDLTLDDAYPDYRSLVEVSEIGTGLPSQNSPTCPATPPFPVYSDPLAGVTVSATLVNHHQVYPAFAFRFDTPDGSIVFSGDTGPDTKGSPDLAKGNLQVLADGADVLVHEVIDTNWVNYKFGTNPPETSPLYALRQHMLESHTQIERIGGVAESCNVGTLVLNHIIPGVTPISRLQEARQGFSGQFIISEDLMQISVSKVGCRVLIGR